MTKIFMIRHGQSMSNTAGTFTGVLNSPLSELGMRQAKLCAEYLKTKSPDAIFSSDLDRAFATATALGEVIDKPVKKLSGFREIDVGEWSNRKYGDVEEEYPEAFNLWHNFLDDAVCPGGESIAQLKRRVIGTLTDIINDYEGKTICVFTHAIPIRAVAAYALGRKIQDTPWAANSSASEFEFDGKKLSLVCYGYNEFLGDNSSILPDDV